jgi:hypothetical protein
VPRLSAIHPFRRITASVRVRLVLSIASISPSRPCVASPTLASTCRIVIWVAVSPVGASAFSYTCVNARAVRRMLAHKHGSVGKFVFWFSLTPHRCIYIYYGHKKLSVTGRPFLTGPWPAFFRPSLNFLQPRYVAV